MSEVWFTSDTHFHHNRILEFCGDTRKGETTEEMNDLMVEAWNSVVKKGDRVYHTGDFCFKGKAAIKEIKGRLNGDIHLVFGNHDQIIRKSKEISEMFTSVQQMKHLKIGEHRFILCHFPISEWWDCHQGTMMIHGHCHGGATNVNYNYRIMDVGIDARKDNLMLPFHIEEVVENLKDRDILPHH